MTTELEKAIGFEMHEATGNPTNPNHSKYCSSCHAFMVDNAQLEAENARLKDLLRIHIDHHMVALKTKKWLKALLEDDEFADRIARDCNDRNHDVRWCPTCENRADGIADYRDAIEALFQDTPANERK